MSASSPAVSLLLPVSSARFFATALDSALAQEYPALEILVGDDSPDDAVARHVADRPDPRVRYLRNRPTLGFHGNFAALFAAAEGEYVKFLNHDDVLHPRCVRRMVAAFQTLGERITLVSARRHLVDVDGMVLPDTAASAPMAARDCVFNGARLGDELLVRSVNRIGEPSATMFRRRDTAPDRGTLFRIGTHAYTCLADLALWLRLLAQGGLAFLATPLVSIRVHDAQLQRAPDVAARCVLERCWLPDDALRLGFLRDAADLEAARTHGRALLVSAGGDPRVQDALRRVREGEGEPA